MITSFCKGFSVDTEKEAEELGFTFTSTVSVDAHDNASSEPQLSIARIRVVSNG